MTGDVVPPHTIVVDVVQHGETFVAFLGLRTARSRAGRPEAATGRNVLPRAVLPHEGATAHLTAGPKVVETFASEQIQEVGRDGGIVHRNHTLSARLAKGASGSPSHVTGTSVPAQVVALALEFVVHIAARPT